MMPLMMIVVINVIIIITTVTIYLVFPASCGHYYPCFTVVETKDLQGFCPRQHNR